MLLWILLTMIKVSCTASYRHGIYINMCGTCTLKWYLIWCTYTVLSELNINFRESDYSFNEGDQESSIILQLREVQYSFTVTLHPVSITEARDPAGFNVSAFVGPVPADAQAKPGK